MGILNRLAGSAWQAGRFLTPSFWAQRQTVPEPIQPRIMWIPRGESGVFMSPDEALKLSAVWACVTVIADGFAASEWEIFEDLPDGNRKPRPDLLTYRLLNQRPNPEMTAFAFRHQASVVANLWGNSYAEIERTAGGAPVALWPLPPERCCLERDTADRLVLRVMNHTREDVVLPYRDVLHFHGPSIDGVYGLETFAYAARSWGHSAALEVFGAAFFGNGTQMSGVLTPDTGAQITPEKRDEMLEGLRRRHAGPQKAHQFLVLTGGMKFQPLTMEPNRAQFIESRQHMVEEVCRWFKVPPHKVAHLLRSTFNNVEHQGLEFTRDCLTPKAVAIAQEVDAKLLPFGNRRLYTRLDLDWLSEGDAKSRAEEDATLVNNGLRTVNEMRRKRGWNTMGPEADVLRTRAEHLPLGERKAAAGANRVTEPEPSEEME